VRARLAGQGIDASHFVRYLHDVDAETTRRLAEGERDHFIYYALQSRRFTRLPAIEPALSARAFVERLATDERRRVIAESSFVPAAGLPRPERARIDALLRATAAWPKDPRLIAFRSLITSEPTTTADAFCADYVRVARFLYRKEFVALVDPSSASRATANLYQDRPHSSDTRAEAGFAVYEGLASLRALDTALRLPRVLIVGPGLDFAPRTDLVDRVEPQSYQPFAVADALLGLSLASPADLHVSSIDINPRVVQWIDALAPGGVTLTFFAGSGADRGSALRDGYRSYLDRLGLTIGTELPAPADVRSDPHFVRSIVVGPRVIRAFDATRLDVVTERLPEPVPFDLIVATNVLTYFSEPQLDLALANLRAMLRPGGYLLQNDSRSSLARQAAEAGLPALHMRSAVIGGPAERPLYDAIWIHQRPLESGSSSAIRALKRVERPAW
jgi:SAM-dependent methyltransferase